MSEMVTYKGQNVTIGTCENIYYATVATYLEAFNAGFLGYCKGNLKPEQYLMPKHNSHFRFPFPDEDGLPFLERGRNDFERALDFKCNHPDWRPANAKELYTLQICQQRPMYRESDGQLVLAVVLLEPNSHRRRYIIDEEDKNALVTQLIRHSISNESNAEKKQLFKEISLRILKGYRLSQQTMSQFRQQSRQISPPVPGKQRKR